MGEILDYSKILEDDKTFSLFSKSPHARKKPFKKSFKNKLMNYGK